MDAAQPARRVLSGAIMVALLAAASLVYSFHERNYDKAYAPLMKYGSVGQAVDAGPFSVKVDKVTLSKSVLQSSYDYSPKYALHTGPSTVFVIVSGREMATTDGTKLSNVLLRAPDGTQYAPSSKIYDFEQFAASTAQPGYWITGDWLFEVPRSAVAGLHFQIGNQTERDVPSQTFPHLGFEFNPAADVDLGIGGTGTIKNQAGYQEPQER